MEDPTLAIFAVSPSPQVLIDENVILVIDFDPIGILVNFAFQLVCLKLVHLDCFSDFDILGFHPMAIILHQVIHLIIPCGLHQAIGLLLKLTVKRCPDTEDPISEYPDPHDTLLLEQKLHVLGRGGAGVTGRIINLRSDIAEPFGFFAEH